MEVFRTFRKLKCLLRVAAFAILLANLQGAWATNYTWNNSVTSGDWSVPANWKNMTSGNYNDGFPGTYDSAIITGDVAVTISLDSDIKLTNITLSSNQNPNGDTDVSGLLGGDQLITINLNNYSFYISNKILVVGRTNYEKTGTHIPINSNVLLTGKGTIKTNTFDFPSGGTHTLKINKDATLKITSNLWADGGGSFTFAAGDDGDGYLYLPYGGANVNNGPSRITYNLDKTHRLPYEAESGETVSPIYSCTITTTTSSPTVSFGGGGGVQFPYKVIITGTEDRTYTLSSGTTTASENFNNSDNSFSPPNGKKYSGTYYNSSGQIKQGSSILTPGGGTFTLSIPSITTAKNGITVIFYSPDGGEDPDNSFMEMGRISWYFKKPTWTGAADSSWTNTANWIGLDGIENIKDLHEFDIEISVQTTSSAHTPVIDLNKETEADHSDVIKVKSLSITGGSDFTLKNGTIITNKITTYGTGKFNSTGGTVELFVYKQDSTVTQPSLEFEFANSITIKKNLTLDEDSIFSMPFDMTLDQLTLNAGVQFSKSSHNLTLGTFWAQTASSSFKSITLNDEFTVKNIIILLRNGNITATKNLIAKNDVIIGGAKYNDSSLKFEHFINRPSGWHSSITDISFSLPTTGTTSDSSTFILSSGAELHAGNSEKGNFYINGANLKGESSVHKLVIPRNDSPENFCAEAVNSTISNITVTCAEGTSDDTSDGSYAQIPATDCSLTGCTNFDSEEFGISSANTVSDNRIYLKFPRPIRKITYPSAIKTSDGTGFTAEYASETGSDAPANPKSSLYLYTANTTWNTDASGTSAGSGSYTNSSGEYRTVIPYLVIPQYITDSSGKVTCGYVITDKWGKRLKSYSPDASAFKDVTDGIPEDKKTKRTPPEFSLSLSPVNNNQIVLGFSKPIITSSSKISYYIDSDNRISISQTMEELLPRCFEIVSIDPAGNAASADIQIDKNSRASISQSSTGLSTITLTLTRNITLSDIENLYIRLIAPKDDSGNLLYPITTYDHQTGKTGLAVSFIQESDKAHTKDGAIYMALNTAHSISDFAIGAINPSYAYNSGISDGGEDLASAYRNIYGEGSSAVHDFSKNQKNYGTISYGSEITLVSKSTSSINSLKLFITDDVDSDSFFKTFSSNFDKQSEAWLPNLTGKIFNYYSSALNSNFQTFNGEAIKSGSSNQGFNTIIPKESVIKMKSGSQLSFVYTICDSSQNPLSHILSPIMTNTETGTYDLSKSVTYPLFALNLSNSSDLLSLSPWYITLKSITEQRGGVTILNNVINAAVGEKTVLKVNMPSSGNLDIMIMTIDGNIVKYLAHGNAGTGEHFYYWDGRNNAGSEVARGIYFVIVKAPGIDENRKVMVVK